MDLQGNPIRELTGHEGAVNSLFHACGNHLLSGSWDGTVRVWDLQTGNTIGKLEGHTHATSVIKIDDIVITGDQTGVIKMWRNG